MCYKFYGHQYRESVYTLLQKNLPEIDPGMDYQGRTRMKNIFPDRQGHISLNYLLDERFTFKIL